MASLHQLSTLAQLPLKPSAWRILESPEQTYMLEFIYDNAQAPQWLPIYTRRNALKNYKSLKSLFSDIKQVQPNALIHFFSQGETNY